MSNQSIYDTLRIAGMTSEGACAMIGNMAAESNMKPSIAQRGMTSMSDENYTAAADNGRIDFANDSVGYGLCQWTFPARKAALLAHARARGLSVGDETAQVTYCVAELRQDYRELWDELCRSHDLFLLTQAVCVKFERPAVANVGTRYEYAQQALAYFKDGKPPDDHVGEANNMTETAAAPDISGALALLAAYLQTEEFAKGFQDYIRGSGK